MNKSEQLIACLEGEIAKRDDRINTLCISMQMDAATIAAKDARIVELEAKMAALKAQEPVAWVGAIEDGVPLLVVEPQNWKATPLYAAPVSEAKAQDVVILDESQEAAEFESQFQGCKAFMRDSHASEAAGKYVCQRSHMFKVWMHFRAMLAAAPEAPAADAGLVDMYRHLQKVTPYRFKKIQDASITDGGDVMYFHKDRFDAALLADMAAHRAKGVV